MVPPCLRRSRSTPLVSALSGAPAVGYFSACHAEERFLRRSISLVWPRFFARYRSLRMTRVRLHSQSAVLRTPIRVLTARRRVRPERSATLCEAHTTSPRSLADGLLLQLHAECVRAGLAPAPLFSGPRGIRTPDLLNAIETRSQLRYGPVWT